MRIALYIIYIVGISFALSFSVFAQNHEQTDAHTCLVRGIAAIEMAKSDNELVDAISEFKKAIEIDPNMPAAWYNMGKVQARLGQLQEAIDSYNHYLALEPQGDDAQKVRDEIIKLEYRLGKETQFKNLSGRWVEVNGTPASVDADGGKIKISFQGSTYFAGSVEVWIAGVLNKPPTTYEFGKSSFDLEAKGKTLEGFFEFSDNSHSDTWCILPTEKNPVTGTLENDRMQLKFKKGKYKVIMDSKAPLLGEPQAICRKIYPIGSIDENLTFMGPLGNGGLNAKISKTDRGTYLLNTSVDSAKELEDGDEIVAVDGADVAALDLGEVIYRLSGQPGSIVQLTLKRKGGEKAMIQVSRVEIAKPR